MTAPIAPISMRERILAAAERRVRATGYNAVSFRDIATDVGVKSASVHYHFPQKQDLGAALVRRYKDNFVAELERIADLPVADAPAADAPGANVPGHRWEIMAAYLGLYDDAFEIDQSVCLCAILGAESIGLPAIINDEIRLFFEANIAWLMATFRPWPTESGQMSPVEIIAAMEGAMIIAAALKDGAVLRRTAERILRDFRGE
ncbi:MAG: TetR/AcrR family transcriptional regulator [Rhodospirillaceae bacterium]|jgi:TetR/AcrR family transcriptional regulator, transcriptional repressor for nem operon|nr:TetR/AcrR family transcriptional regulator [Rhodospirillaceae bacterium]MBT5194583.1 TetR/AcrR family transcriptional regulator [Rhodospirillaceae bacterium]MBT5897464.1 TetR/AcrR family transcriptional regulator [Rhodospirillaceae bacterium]MBT6427508.1 TetR/AcrR family transcriptional regulator [Rhodospirillaceae bacterium]MBT7756499.1 TetR/AcrR family transcriptional regulator [Rhodospirillaceae bacterium]